jgi:hypothetical protein
MFVFLKIFSSMLSDAQGVYHPLDETRPNPNGIEVNLINFENKKINFLLFFSLIIFI